MAKTQPATYSFTVMDEIGVKASITQYLLLDPAMTVAQLAAAWQAQELLVQAVLSAGVQHGDARLDLVPTDGAVTPASGSRVEQTGLFTFGNATNSRGFGQDFAGWSNAKISSGHIPLGDTDVAALVTAMTTPASLSEFTSNQFLVLNALRTTAITFRKRRRLESRLTSEVG